MILKGLARDPEKRWQNAHEMAGALEKAYPVGSTRDVGEWVRAVYAEALIQRAKSVAEIENLELPAAGSDRPRAASHASLPHIAIHIPKAPRVPDGTSSNVEAPAGVPKSKPMTRYAIVAGGAALALLLIVSLALSTSKHDTAPAASAAATSSTARPVIPPPIPTPDSILARAGGDPGNAGGPLASGEHAGPCAASQRRQLAPLRGAGPLRGAFPLRQSLDAIRRTR